MSDEIARLSKPEQLKLFTEESTTNMRYLEATQIEYSKSNKYMQFMAEV